MKLKIISIILFVMFICSLATVSMASTVLYKRDEDIFSKSASLVHQTFGPEMEKEAISSVKEIFLSQVRSETKFLYLLTHGLPKKGIMISNDERVSWDEFAQNVRADTLIVDTCFSGQILKEHRRPGSYLIISGTTSDNFSYNPGVEDDRISLLSYTLHLYFNTDRKEELKKEYGENLSFYSKRVVEVFGVERMLEQIKYNHLRLYANLITKEDVDFARVMQNSEKATNIDFKGFTSIQYHVGK